MCGASPQNPTTEKRSRSSGRRLHADDRTVLFPRPVGPHPLCTPPSSNRRVRARWPGGQVACCGPWSRRARSGDSELQQRPPPHNEPCQDGVHLQSSPTAAGRGWGAPPKTNSLQRHLTRVLILGPRVAVETPGSLSQKEHSAPRRWGGGGFEGAPGCTWSPDRSARGLGLHPGGGTRAAKLSVREHSRAPRQHRSASRCPFRREETC